MAHDGDCWEVVEGGLCPVRDLRQKQQRDHSLGNLTYESWLSQVSLCQGPTRGSPEVIYQVDSYHW